MSRASRVGLAVALGLLAAVLDYGSKASLFVPLLLLGGGLLLGAVSPEPPWAPAVAMAGCAVLGIAIGMAMRLPIARPHYVLLDLRGIVPALLGAAAGAALRRVSRPDRGPSWDDPAARGGSDGRPRETRVGRLGRVGPHAVALLAGLALGALDLEATDVQGILVLLLMASFAMGFARPAGAWRWPVWIALGLPIVSLASRPFREMPSPASADLGSLIAVVPCLLAAYAGVVFRELAGLDTPPAGETE